MKKSFILFMGLLLLMNFSSGQKCSLGITAGAVFSSYKEQTSVEQPFKSKTNTGFTVGIASSLAFCHHWSFMPALNFIQKGGKRDDPGSPSKTVLNYIELPLNVVFQTNSPEGKFFVGAGPSISMGLSGKFKWKDNGGSGSSDINFGSGIDDYIKAFEAGVNFLAGFQLKSGFLITANYNTGLSDLGLTSYPADTSPIEHNYHNRYFGIRVGYMFAGKK
jgi:Outer membrane protein beta-barrel domain